MSLSLPTPRGPRPNDGATAVNLVIILTALLLFLLDRLF